MRVEGRQRGQRDLDRQLADRGLRLTAQRRRVYAALVGDLDHPTAEQVFLRVKRRMPEISLATVYNCLEALVMCGLARRVQIGEAACHFCANMQEHGHFYCGRCGGIFDVAPGRALELPPGFEAERFEVSVHGICPRCAGQPAVGGGGTTRV